MTLSIRPACILVLCTPKHRESPPDWPGRSDVHRSPQSSALSPDFSSTFRHETRLFVTPCDPFYIVGKACPRKSSGRAGPSRPVSSATRKRCDATSTRYLGRLARHAQETGTTACLGNERENDSHSALRLPRRAGARTLLAQNSLNPARLRFHPRSPMLTTAP